MNLKDWTPSSQKFYFQAERSQIISQLKPLTAEDKQFRTVMDEKRREMEPLHAALGKLRDANNTERGMGICSSEDELNSFVSQNISVSDIFFLLRYF